MDGWSVTQQMIVCQGRQLKKSSNRKSKLVLSALVTTWLSNIAFHLLPIWLQTLIAIDSESRLTLFPSFCVPPSEVAALFYSNLSRCPFLGQVIDLDLLLCTGSNQEHEVLFLCHIFHRLQSLCSGSRAVCSETPNQLFQIADDKSAISDKSWQCSQREKNQGTYRHVVCSGTRIAYKLNSRG